MNRKMSQKQVIYTNSYLKNRVFKHQTYNRLHQSEARWLPQDIFVKDRMLTISVRTKSIEIDGVILRKCGWSWQVLVNYDV